MAGLNRFQLWVLRKTEPWREEKASLDLEWRLYAQKHNAAGKRPLCWYPGMEEEKGLQLDPEGKVHMYEFPIGPDSLDQPLYPDYLRNMHDYSDVKPMKPKA
ncbi:hypothetical protein LCGC14_3051870, partial [marine sediment metagenome]